MLDVSAGRTLGPNQPHVALCTLRVAWCLPSSMRRSGSSFAKTSVKTYAADSKPFFQLQIKWGCSLACYST